jgi:D-alanine-D-alanine ligase
MKKIIVLMGGISQEREISLRSGDAVYKALESTNKDVEMFILSEDIKSFIDYIINLKSVFKGDIVIFNALHGRFGEDGRIQALLDLLKVPYTHSGVLASSLSMNKIITKKLHPLLI